MKIILAGGGNPENVAPVDKYFVSLLDLEKTVLYIPVAMESHVHSYEECYDWFKETYNKYGIYNIEMCTNLNTIDINNKYSAVFIGGGNTFKLLSEIQSSNFQEQIYKFLENDGILYGGSAGAIVCGKTIKSAEYLDKNNIDLKDLNGLNLLNNYDVFCHNDCRSDDFTKNYDNNLYILYEESGLVFDGKTAQSLGKPFITKTK